MQKRPCKSCRCLFSISRRHLHQAYCCQKKCQRARKTAWQCKKMRQDVDYRENQIQAQARWQKNHPNYWKEYRRKNSSYTERNRENQKIRNQKKRLLHTKAILKPIAKMDVAKPKNPIISGIYELIPVKQENIAKMDAMIVSISELSSAYG